MSTLASIAGITLILGIFAALVPIALLIVLQVWLCKKGRRLGLILPALSLILSLLLVFSMAAFSRFSVGGAYVVSDENGQLIEQSQDYTEYRQPLTAGAVVSIAALFLVSNIPTVVYGGIWLHYKGRRDTQDDLERMRIEDLG